MSGKWQVASDERHVTPTPFIVWCGFLLLALVVAPGIAKASRDPSPSSPTFDQQAYSQIMKRGIEAYQQGDLGAAGRAFQEAYLMKPTDPVLLSWMSLVQDEQQRREAMTRALDTMASRMSASLVPEVEAAEMAQAEAATSTEAATVETTEGSAPPQRSFWERLGMPLRAPLSWVETKAGVGTDRPEILEAGKRAGYQRLYKEGIGFQPIRGLGFSGRTEIYEEPNPVEDYVLETNILNFQEISQLRRSIVPLFTRSAAARVVADYEPLPRFTYEYDARETLNEFTTRYGFKDIDRQTHAVNALYSFPKISGVGQLTVNPWYKRVLQSSDHDLGSYEHRDEFILNTTLQPTENIEYFFQFDTFDADKTRSLGASKLKLYKGQVRLRVPSLKLFLIPSFEYSETDYDPSDDEFIKRDMFVDWGMDLTKRLRFSSKEQIVLAETVQPGKIPSNPDAEVYNTFNTLSYELFRDFDVSFGVDYSRAAGMNSFNNVGLRAEMELFKPGLIRSKLGYEWLSYYNISEDLSLLYWRFFLFQ